MAKLIDKTALVTGASRGIGRATAISLASEGAHVFVHYGRGESEAAAVVEHIRRAGGSAETVMADLGSSQGPHDLASRVRILSGNRLDVVVCNAGVSLSRSIEDTNMEEFDRLFAVNVRAPFFIVQQLLPALREGSSVVLISSLVARSAVGTLPAYAATKGAIETMVKYFAAALGSRGVRVNAVAPGVVETDMSSFTKTPEGREVALGLQSLKRLAQPADIAAAVTFLATDDARWVTGDSLHVDGGSKL